MSKTETVSNIKNRVTALSRSFMQESADFQEELIAQVKEAGFNGIYINGGSGYGPNNIRPEAMSVSPVIPDLMPHTIKVNQREMKRRSELMKSAGMNPWLLTWGIPGPNGPVDETKLRMKICDLLGRQTRMEMEAKLEKDPDIFGHIAGDSNHAWHGFRPLCISHPLVKEYYIDLYTRIVKEYGIKGLVTLPGDIGVESCDDSCERCRSTGLDEWERIAQYWNDVFMAVKKIMPEFKLYFCVWNSGFRNIETITKNLHSEIGICMTLCQGAPKKSESGVYHFGQPCMDCGEVGETFKDSYEKMVACGRQVMADIEMCQSEVWDPVCHNLPFAVKTIQNLKNMEAFSAIDGLSDFWGHRRPVVPHANLAAMHAYFKKPDMDESSLLNEAARRHYSISESESILIDTALECWQQYNATVEELNTVAWMQRFSPSIGRWSARGSYYKAIIPPYLKKFKGSWQDTSLSDRIDGDLFMKYQLDDCRRLGDVAQSFRSLGLELQKSGLNDSAKTAFREADMIELQGEMFGSQGRWFAAVKAYHGGNSERLAELVEQEIEARSRHLDITGRLGFGAGVNAFYVTEDIQNMCLYLSQKDFPDTADEYFRETPDPLVLVKECFGTFRVNK